MDRHNSRGHISLHSLGISDSGSICDRKWMTSVKIPRTQSIINPNFFIDLPDKKLLFKKSVAHGTFGRIDLAERKTVSGTTNVFVKRPILPGQSLFYEACIQKLTRNSLDRGGFDAGTPDIYDIFKLSDNSTCFTMEIFRNSKTLWETLTAVDSREFDTILKICLIQICGMTWYLHNDIGINHRDLKPSNILIGRTSSHVKRTYTIRDNSVKVDTPFHIAFIDYGFCCIGNPGTSSPALSLGSVYDKRDPCPKSGRDMYQLLSFIYTEFRFKMSATILNLFEKWLNTGDYSITQLIKKHAGAGAGSCDNWIYLISGDPSIRQFQCSNPHVILQDLAALV